MTKLTLTMLMLLTLLWVDGAGADTELVCESRGDQYRYCEASIDGDVELVDQMSRSACTLNESWGYDRGGIWVDRGCRARFRIVQFDSGTAASGSLALCHDWIVDELRRDEGLREIDFERAEQYAIGRDEVGIRGEGRGRDGRGAVRRFEYRCEVDEYRRRVSFADHQMLDSGFVDLPVTQTVTCESEGGRRQHCAVDHIVSAELEQQLSRSACIEDRSWGVDAQGLWVDQGCRGRFGVTVDERDHSGRPDVVQPEPATEVTCESRGDRYQRCELDRPVAVELIEQLSRSSCQEGSSWGWDDQGVWVDRGCRARFAVYSGRTTEGGHRPVPDGDWDAVIVCHDELVRQARQRHGADARLYLQSPVASTVDRNQQELVGNGSLDDDSGRSAVEYRCRADVSRRFLLEATFSVAEEPARPDWDSTPICQQEILRKVRAQEGGGVQLAFDAAELDTSRPGQQRVAGRATISNQRSARSLDYSCRVDTERRVVMGARFDFVADGSTGDSAATDAGVGHPVDLNQAVEICKSALSDRIRAERGHDKTLTWGVVTTYPALVQHQIRVAGRGGTFRGSNRDRTFDVECIVDLRSGRVVSASHRYN